MDAHFHSSLKELRLQLDLMNSRTASILNNPRQQFNMLTPDSSRVDFSPCVTVDNMQQIKHIGATVGTLAKHQEDRFQALERQLNALSNKLDDLVLGNPQFTPPESPSESASVSSRSDTASIPSQNSSMPCSLSSDMPPATVADVGGYFYPNYVQRGRSDQQFITDASSFVGRVYRVLRTKSIPNIEIFLRGSALRWFHLGLKTDGTHLFDMFSGDFSLIDFCDSLISLFGVPESLASAANIKTLPLTSSWMRSVIIEDYIFPALEYVRPQEKLYAVDSGASVAVSKALALYNQSSKPCTVSPEIYDCTADAQIQDMCDLQFTLRDIRCSELEQKLNRLRSRDCQIGTDAVFTELGAEGTKKKPISSSKVEQDSVPAAVSEFNGKTSTSTLAGMYDRTEVQSKSCSLRMPGGVEVEDADTVASAVESYPPAPTAESCPTTPIVSCRPPSRKTASWTDDACEGIRIAAAKQPEKRTQYMHNNATYQIPDYLQDTGGISAAEPACDRIDTSMPMSPEPVKYSSNEIGGQPIQQEKEETQQLLDMTMREQQMTTKVQHLKEMQQMARLQLDALEKESNLPATSQRPLFQTPLVSAISQCPDSHRLDDLYYVSERDSTCAPASKLETGHCLVPEPIKEARSLKNATGDVSTTANTATSDHRSQQQTSEHQQILQAQHSFVLSPQAKAYLNGFRVCPPPNISPNTSEYEKYQRSIMSTLSTLFAIQTSGRNRIDEVLTEMQELQNAGQNTPPDLLSACYTAMKDEQTATDKIDAIFSGNYKNRLALMNKHKQPPKRKTLVAPRRNSSVNARPCTTQLATSAKSENEE